VSNVDAGADSFFAEVYRKANGWVTVCSPTSKVEAAKAAARAYRAVGADGELPSMVRLVTAQERRPGSRSWRPAGS
jgi:hypothetical protein